MNRKEARKLIERILKEKGEVWYNDVEEQGISVKTFNEICYDDLGLDPLENGD